MQVQSVNYRNNQPKFGAIFKFDAKYSKMQYKIMNSITDDLRKNVTDLNFESIEKQYEKQGYDFIFYPEKDNQLTLRSYFNLKKVGIGQYKTGYYLKNNSFFIGTYNYKNNFKLSDLKNIIKEPELNNEKIQETISIIKTI
ncbi:hypothetical protein J6G99_08130 [bacterium]|nr:hypothetical protein [bacterium]